MNVKVGMKQKLRYFFLPIV